MAARRMFSSQIVASDLFLEMPMTSQALYFHLGMNADDDGFVSPRKVLRMIGAGEDDLKVLLTKGFVIQFQSGVIVVTHWKQNNYIQKDRYTPTIYGQEKAMLSCIQNVYTLDTPRIQSGYAGRKEGREEETNFISDRNAEALSPARVQQHFDKGRDILRRPRHTRQ